MQNTGDRREKLKVKSKKVKGKGKSKKGKGFVIDYPFDVAQDRFTIDD